MGGVGVTAYLSLIGIRRGGRLFEAGRLLTFPAFRMGAYSGWARIRINTVFIKGCCCCSSSVKQCLSSVNHEQFLMQMTQNCMHSNCKCLQILAEEDFTLKLLRGTPIKIFRRAIEEDNRDVENIA